MKNFVVEFSGDVNPTTAPVDKDIPKPLKYSIAFVLYGIVGFIAFKVFINIHIARMFTVLRRQKSYVHILYVYILGISIS